LPGVQVVDEAGVDRSLPAAHLRRRNPPANGSIEIGVCVWPEYPLSAKELILCLLVNLQVLLRGLELSEESVLEPRLPHWCLLKTATMDGAGCRYSGPRILQPGQFALDAEVSTIACRVGQCSDSGR